MPRKESALAKGFVGYAIAVDGGVRWKVLPILEVPACGSTSCTCRQVKLHLCENSCSLCTEMQFCMCRYLTRNGVQCLQCSEPPADDADQFRRNV